MQQLETVLQKTQLALAVETNEYLGQTNKQTLGYLKFRFVYLLTQEVFTHDS